MESTTMREQLLALQEVDVEKAQDFCRVALQFLLDGVQERLVEKAARKLDWSAEKLQQILDALMELLRSAAQKNASAETLVAYLSSVGLHAELVAVLVEFVTASQPEVRIILDRLSFSNAKLKNFDWRFEVEIASRSIHNQCKPYFLMNLELQRDKSTESRILQMDIPMLIRLTEELETALNDGKSSHTRKMMRHLR